MSKKSTKKTRPCLNSYVLEMTILFNIDYLTYKVHTFFRSVQKISYFSIKNIIELRRSSFMNEIVDKLILLDREGQEKIIALENEKKELSTYIKEIRKNLTKEYKTSNREKIAEVRTERKNDYKERAKKVRLEAKEKEKNDVVFFKEYEEQWLEELVNFCLKV